MIRADDIRDMHARRRLFQQKGIDAVVKRCNNKIKSVIDTRTNASSCVLEVPEFLLGFPIYDLTDCILFVKHHLETSGFKVFYIFPRLLIVSWESAIANGRLLCDTSTSKFDVKPSGKVVLSLV